VVLDGDFAAVERAVVFRAALLRGVLLRVPLVVLVVVLDVVVAMSWVSPLWGVRLMILVLSPSTRSVPLEHMFVNHPADGVTACERPFV
jgi:hypothetical protein